MEFIEAMLLIVFKFAYFFYSSNGKKFGSKGKVKAFLEETKAPYSFEEINFVILDKKGSEIIQNMEDTLPDRKKS